MMSSMSTDFLIQRKNRWENMGKYPRERASIIFPYFPMYFYTPQKNRLTWLTSHKRDQLWAEAVALYRTGNVSLRIKGELAQISKQTADRHNYDYNNPIYDEIDAFLDMELPHDWDSRDITARRTYIDA